MSSNDLYEHRQDFFLKLSPSAQGGIALFIVLGVVTFIVGMAIGEYSRTWGSLLFNTLFFYFLAIGGVTFGGMQDLIGALWGRPIKRLHEGFSSFLPVGSLILALFLVCIKLDVLSAKQVYSWIADPNLLEHFPGKRDWLQENFMIWRDLIALVVVLYLARWHMKSTLAPDFALLQGQKDQAKKLAQAGMEKRRYWAAPVLVLHSLAFSILVFDLTMSLAPTWMSTLWGGWSFAMMMQILMAFILVMMFSLEHTALGQYFHKQQYHDIGKLLHGFTVFFAYLTFAHVLTYWYTNIPEETSYFMTRMAFPWIYFIIAAPFLCFLIPFLMLIPKVSKWSRPLTMPICLIVLLSQWLNSMLVVIPEVADPTVWRFPWIELGLFCGLLGGFLLVFFRFAQKTPMLSIADPLLHKALSKSH